MLKTAKLITTESMSILVKVKVVLWIGYFMIIMISCSESLEKSSSKWLIDSSNCKGTRNKRRLYSIVEALNSRNIIISKSIIVSALGKSNIETNSENGIDFCYYLGDGCFNRNIENCYTCITLDTVTNKLKIDSKNIICE